MLTVGLFPIVTPVAKTCVATARQKLRDTLLPSVALAVIIVEPPALAVITPPLFIVATLVFALDQLTVLFAAHAGVTVAVIVLFCPTGILPVGTFPSVMPVTNADMFVFSSFFLFTVIGAA